MLPIRCRRYAMPRRSRVFGQFALALAFIVPSLVSAATPTAGKQIRVKLSLHVQGNF